MRLSEVLQTLPQDRQAPWQALREPLGTDGLPETFAEVVDGVVEFIDPLFASDIDDERWNPSTRRWE